MVFRNVYRCSTTTEIEIVETKHKKYKPKGKTRKWKKSHTQVISNWFCGMYSTTKHTCLEVICVCMTAQKNWVFSPICERWRNTQQLLDAVWLQSITACIYAKSMKCFIREFSRCIFRRLVHVRLEFLSVL